MTVCVVRAFDTMRSRVDGIWLTNDREGRDHPVHVFRSYHSSTCFFLSSHFDIIFQSDMKGAQSLMEHLTTEDVYSLDPEHRILLLELLVEWLLAIDLIDDHMISASTKAGKATHALNLLYKQRKERHPAAVTTSASSAVLSSLDKETGGGLRFMEIWFISYSFTGSITVNRFCKHFD